MREARKAIEESLGGRLEDHFAEFGPPVAGRLHRQVHKAVVGEGGTRREVAVKILRPGIERRFRRDLDSYFFAARQIERWHLPTRRLRPVVVVDTLARSVEIEMDLRLEAAAISEMADNIVTDQALPDGRLRVPGVDWRRTSKRVLTLEWIDGIPISDHAALKAAGHDLKALGLTILRSFLRHAMRDGFFHADMHQGNLLVDKTGTIVAVDFGIMGRLGPRERRFLAEILHGLITRDYRRTAMIHFEAGYVPPHQSVELFAQAMRADRRADPWAHGRRDLHGRPAGSAVRLHGGFRYADAAGAAAAAEDHGGGGGRGPLARSGAQHLERCGTDRQAWIESNYGVTGRLREAGEGAEVLGR
jgi:ubiquinone biosynthesis protein